MKIIITVLAFATLLTISGATNDDNNKDKKHPAFSKVLYDYSEESTTAAPPKSCACADKPGLYANPIKTISETFQQISVELEEFGNELASHNHTHASNLALATSSDTGHISKVLKEQYMQEKTEAVLLAIGGAVTYAHQVKKVVGKLTSVAEGKVGGEALGPDYSPGSAKLNSLTSLALVVEALTKAVRDFAKSSKSLQKKQSIASAGKHITG